MDIPVFLDDDARTALSEYASQRIAETIRSQCHGVRLIALRKDTIPPCCGCLCCVTKHAGRCVHQQTFADIVQESPGSPLVVFLSPVSFGTFSSTMKNVIDRAGLIVTNHNSCRQVIIGYGNDATDEERDTFIDLTAKHRGKADVVHPKALTEEYEVFFARSPAESDRICDRLGRLIREEVVI